MAKKKRNKSLLLITKAKLIEWIGFGAILVLFAVLALLNRHTLCAAQPDDRVAETAENTPQLQQLTDAAASAAFVFSEDGTLHCPDGSLWTYAVETDERGIVRFSLSAPLYPSEKGESETVKTLNEQNAAVRKQLLALLERIYPVFGGDAIDAERVVQSCESAASTGTAKLSSVGSYKLAIRFDPDAGVTLRFERIKEE